ncbi:MAG: hypothetical protein U5K37_08245 [Natrialbaceae archaeon]|nr:hypothetical protein [Natrialbaceae archaeon]
MIDHGEPIVVLDVSLRLETIDGPANRLAVLVYLPCNANDGVTGLNPRVT